MLEQEFQEMCVVEHDTEVRSCLFGQGRMTNLEFGGHGDDIHNNFRVHDRMDGIENIPWVTGGQCGKQDEDLFGSMDARVLRTCLASSRPFSKEASPLPDAAPSF